ncbi:hypothetical protein [Pontibacter liquoris]|uniref:hypothetical protein n=1 Tax=Pontibacter liquoris TaxID=2905677 RepID=UPI001FA75C12|nr:hypothetical protein [Pontibacter liquoris]
MKRSLSVGFALLLGTVLFSSCDTCDPATITPLQTGDEAWLTYERGDTIRFINETNQPVTYLCVDLSGGNVPAVGYEGEKCIAKMDTQAGAIIQDTKNKYLAMGTFITRRPENFTLQLAVENRGTWEVDENNPKYPTLQVNGVNYNNVFEVKLDSTKASDLKRLLYSKEKGFISVEYYDGKKLLKQP